MAKPTWMGIPLREMSLAMLTIQYSSFVLLLHYSRVMPLIGGHRYLPSTAVFLHEVVKLAVCLTFALYETSQQLPRTAPATSLFGVLFRAIFSGDSWKMAIPACLYTLANNLQFIGISNLDAATFQVTYQVKIIVTAVFSVAILGQRLSMRKWLALLLLMLGVIIVSIPHGSSGPLSEGAHIRVHVPRDLEAYEAMQEGLGESAVSSHLAKRSATYEGIEEDEMLLNPRMNAAVGLIAVIGLCIASGLGGVYFEKVLKEAPEKTSLWVRNVQLAIYSLFPALFIGVMFLDGETVAKNGFFDGYNWVVFVTIGFQAFGGIVAAFCIFYADNISKNFATSISMVISSLASFFFFDFEATGNFLAGTSLVLFATWLYNSQDVRSRARPPPIKIHSFEKTTIDLQVPHADDKSIKIPVSPFRKEAALTTSRPPSPIQQHRIGTGRGYFEKHRD